MSALVCVALQPCLFAAERTTSRPTLLQADESPHSEWSVIAYGDTRFTDPSNVIAVNPKVRRWLVQKIADESPDAVLLSGDLPYTGSDSHDYVIFREETRVWQERHIHLYPALGNHELKGGDNLGLVNWWKTFPELNGHRWYSVSYGNVYFICLDTDSPLTDGSEQRNWFDEQITNLPVYVQFVFVVQHRPPIADLPMDSAHTPQTNEIAFAQHLEEKAKNLRTRFIVIAGHIHNYERFNQQGVTFLVSGGGGARPHAVMRGPEDLYQDPTFPNYHYLKFVFDGKRVHASMIRVANPMADVPQWEIKDNFFVEVPSGTISAHTVSNE